MIILSRSSIVSLCHWNTAWFVSCCGRRLFHALVHAVSVQGAKNDVETNGDWQAQISWGPPIFLFSCEQNSCEQNSTESCSPLSFPSSCTKSLIAWRSYIRMKKRS